MKAFMILGALFLCAYTGQQLTQVATGLHPETVRAEEARIVFFRTRDSALYIARKATILIDGQKMGGVGYGKFQYHDVEAGEHLLRADMWDMPGECVLTLNADAGETYFFQVDPRAESFGAFAAGDVAGWVLSENVLVSVAGGVGAVAIESYGQECGGAFRLYPVDAATAKTRMDSLKRSV